MWIHDVIYGYEGIYQVEWSIYRDFWCYLDITGICKLWRLQTLGAFVWESYAECTGGYCKGLEKSSRMFVEVEIGRIHRDEIQRR